MVEPRQFSTSLPSFLEEEAELHGNIFIVDLLVSEYIASLGLTLSIALLVAFRAGQARNINSINMEDKLNQLTIDALKDKIVSQVEMLVRVYRETTPGLDFELPPIQPIAQQILFTEESIPYLNSLYTSLIENGTQAESFLQVLQFLVG